MALVVNDRVKESTAVVGTGTATLLGAALGDHELIFYGRREVKPQKDRPTDRQTKSSQIVYLYWISAGLGGPTAQDQA